MGPIRRFPWKPIALGGVALGVIGAIALTGSAKRKPSRVALIGDSYAVGLGPELAKYFPSFRYEGHTGTNTYQWASHAAACVDCGDWISSWKPDIALVALGVNDVAPDTSNYHSIVGQLHGSGARVVWIKPPMGVSTPSFNAVHAAIDSLGIQTIPSTSTPLAVDGLHPKSYAPWAEEIAGAVTRG